MNGIIENRLITEFYLNITFVVLMLTMTESLAILQLWMIMRKITVAWKKLLGNALQSDDHELRMKDIKLTTNNYYCNRAYIQQRKMYNSGLIKLNSSHFIGQKIKKEIYILSMKTKEWIHCFLKSLFLILILGTQKMWIPANVWAPLVSKKLNNLTDIYIPSCSIRSNNYSILVYIKESVTIPASLSVYNFKIYLKVVGIYQQCF